jgi:hypothetical protein
MPFGGLAVLYEAILRKGLPIVVDPRLYVQHDVNDEYIDQYIK